MKVCNKCRENLPDSEFHKRTYKTGNVGLQSSCRTCSSRQRVKYYKPHDTARRRHKLTDEEYTTLIAESQGKCNVCSRPLTKACIDHDHTTGKVRGVLCNNCNTSLGLVGDNTTTLTRLIQYLEQSRQQE